MRPYSQAFEAWVASGEQDKSRLLRGQALKDASYWAQGKSLSDLDYQFLAASQDVDRQELQLFLEAERLKEVEARLALKKKKCQTPNIFDWGTFVCFSECDRRRNIRVLPVPKSPRQPTQ